MLSKEERKEKNTQFWEQFRKMIKDQRSVNGRQMNWINYPTDLQDIYLRMVVDSDGASLCLDIQPKDDGIRTLLWEQMEELRIVLDDAMECEAEWIQRSHHYNGRLISRIKWTDDTLNYFNEEDVPKINEFLKEKLIGFDKFYQEYKDILINLAN